MTASVNAASSSSILRVRRCVARGWPTTTHARRSDTGSCERTWFMKLGAATAGGNISAYKEVAGLKTMTGCFAIYLVWRGVELFYENWDRIKALVKEAEVEE